MNTGENAAGSEFWELVVVSLFCRLRQLLLGWGMAMEQQDHTGWSEKFVTAFHPFQLSISISLGFGPYGIIGDYPSLQHPGGKKN